MKLEATNLEEGGELCSTSDWKELGKYLPVKRIRLYVKLVETIAIRRIVRKAPKIVL